MTDILYEEALAHFGVKGMKWGVRREGSTGGGRTARTPEQKAETKRKIVKGAKIAGGTLAVAGGVALVVMNANRANAKDAAALASALQNIKNDTHKFQGFIESHRGTYQNFHTPQARQPAPYNAAAAKKAKQYYDNISKGQQTVKKMNLRDTMLADIMDAHASQTRYMQETFAKSGGVYNPRSNPFSPEARRLGA